MDEPLCFLSSSFLFVSALQLFSSVVVQAMGFSDDWSAVPVSSLVFFNLCMMVKGIVLGFLKQTWKNNANVSMSSSCYPSYESFSFANGNQYLLR